MASKLERTCVHARGCIWPASSSFLPSIHVTRAPFPPLIASSTHRILHPSPTTIPLVLLSLSGHVSFCVYDFFLSFFPSWHYWVYDLVLRTFFFTYADWRYLSDWCMASVNFLRFFAVVGLIYFDWWIYFSFFFLGREKESKLDRVQVISDFRSLSCL